MNLNYIQKKIGTETQRDINIPRDKNGWRLDGVMDPEGKFPNPFNGEKYSQTYFDKGINHPDKPWNDLPVYNDRYEFLDMIKNNRVIL